MFSKHVWYDRKHQAEVFITDEGVISGTIVAYEGAVCVVNPRPEILLALYQEAKIKRILAVKGVILTNNSIDFTRGLCAFVNYSRGLRRRSPLAIISRSDSHISTDFLSNCCSKLWGDSAFDLTFSHLRSGESYQLGKGAIRFVPTAENPGGEFPYLAIETEKEKSLHYYDESHEGRAHIRTEGTKPNLVIRATELPGYAQHVRRQLVA